MSLTGLDSRNRCQVTIREGLEDPLGAIGHANGPSRFGEYGGGDVNVPNTSRMRENHTHLNHQVGTHIVHVRHVMVGQPLSHFRVQFFLNSHRRADFSGRTLEPLAANR